MSVVHFLPHTGQVPSVPVWTRGIQRELTPARSFMASSHSRLPHHLDRRKPPFPSTMALASS